MKIEAGRTEYFNGFRLSLEMPQHVKRVRPGGTATHEAMHVVGALENGTGVKSATIVPGEGYSGLTELTRADPIAAMAPHSMGADGTSYDVYIAGLMGNAGSAESAARGIINANMNKVEAVATVLEEKRTINSSDISNAIDELKNPKPKTGTLFIESEEGERKEEKVEVRDNVIVVPDQLIEVFSAKPKIN